MSINLAKKFSKIDKKRTDEYIQWFHEMQAISVKKDVNRKLELEYFGRATFQHLITLKNELEESGLITKVNILPKATIVRNMRPLTMIVYVCGRKYTFTWDDDKMLNEYNLPKEDHGSGWIKIENYVFEKIENEISKIMPKPKGFADYLLKNEDKELEQFKQKFKYFVAVHKNEKAIKEMEEEEKQKNHIRKFLLG